MYMAILKYVHRDIYIILKYEYWKHMNRDVYRDFKVRA